MGKKYLKIEFKNQKALVTEISLEGPKYASEEEVKLFDFCKMNVFPNAVAKLKELVSKYCKVSSIPFKKATLCTWLEFEVINFQNNKNVIAERNLWKVIESLEPDALAKFDPNLISLKCSKTGKCDFSALTKDLK